MTPPTPRAQDRRHAAWTAALCAALTVLFAAPFSWHVASQLLTRDADAMLIQWILAWDIHAFVHQPLHLFDANIFAPLPGTLAYAENLIGSAAIAAPIVWLTHNVVLAHNLVLLLSVPVGAAGMFLLARRVGATTAGAVLAALIFSFAPPRFFRIEQLQLMTIQWMPWALASLHAYLDDGRRRDLHLALLFFYLQALTAGHGAVFLTVAIAGLLVYRIALGEPLRLRTRLSDCGWIGAALIGLTVWLFVPYRQAQLGMGLSRTLDGWETPWSDLFGTPSLIDARVHAWLLPEALRQPPSAYLFPGYLPLALVCVAALVLAVRALMRADRRAWLARAATSLEVIATVEVIAGAWALWSSTDRLKIAGITLLTTRHAGRLWVIAAAALIARWALRRAVPVASFAQRLRTGRARWPERSAAWRGRPALYYALLLALTAWLLLGPPFGVWQWVYRWPLFSFVRVPTRFSLLLVLALGLLAGLAFDRLTRSMRGRGRSLAAAVMGAALVAECWGGPMPGRDAAMAIPEADRWLATQPAPFTVAELPMPNPEDGAGFQNYRNAQFMLHSTAHWQKTVHGYSGLLPASHERLFAALSTLPSEASRTALHEFQVTYLIAHADLTDAAERAALDRQMAPAADWLVLVHEAPDGRVYKVR